MRTGRPAKKETPYKIIVHTNGGRRYASTKITIVREDGSKQSRHKHWGTVDDNNRFHPNTTYFNASPQERARLIIPSDWILEEATGRGEAKRGRVEYSKDDVDRQYGPTWFLDKVAEETGIKADLLRVFGGNEAKVGQILTMAYFPFIDNLSYSQLARWQKEVKAPTDISMTPKAVTILTQSINEQNRMDLFRMRAARVGKDELCAVDSTSISSYGFNLVDIRWGRNKEHLPLRQTVEVVVYSITSHMPIFYLELPGNMPDSRTVELIMKELEHAGFRNLILITDRGYESLKNLELYISRRQKVITSVKVGQGDVLKKIKAIDLSSGIPEGMSYDTKSELFYSQYDCSYSVKGNGDNVIEADRLKINLYFSVEGRARAITAMQNDIAEQTAMAQRLVDSKETIADERSLARQLNMLSLTIDDKKQILTKFEVDREKRDVRLRTSGFFASKTVGLDLDPLQAMDNYGMRDEQEKCFQLQKGPLGQDRTRCWSESAKHGRMFICFVGLILASYVRSVWESNDYLRKKFGSTESVLAEMRTIRCIEHKGRLKFVTPFVGEQVEICKAFGFDIPVGCAPAYTSKAKSKTPKRGRPSKPKTEIQEI
ncbi:MAG: transposase [Lachnospiraceae bacterium]